MNVAERFRMFPSASRVLLLDLEVSGEKFDPHYYSKAVVKELRHRRLVEPKELRLTNDAKELLGFVWKQLPGRWKKILRERVTDLHHIRELNKITLQDKEILFAKKFKTVAKISKMDFSPATDFHGQRKQLKGDADADIIALSSSARWVLCVLAGQPGYSAPLSYFKPRWGWKKAAEELKGLDIIQIDKLADKVFVPEQSKWIIEESCEDLVEDVDTEKNGEEEGN